MRIAVALLCQTVSCCVTRSFTCIECVLAAISGTTLLMINLPAKNDPITPAMTTIKI